MLDAAVRGLSRVLARWGSAAVVLTADSAIEVGSLLKTQGQQLLVQGRLVAADKWQTLRKTWNSRSS